MSIIYPVFSRAYLGSICIQVVGVDSSNVVLGEAKEVKSVFVEEKEEEEEE